MISKYNLLDPSNGCNQILPINTLVDTIHIETLIEIRTESGGKHVKVEVPLTKAMPSISKSFRAIGIAKTRLEQLLEGGPTILEKSPEHFASISLPLSKISIRSLSSLLKRGHLTIGEEKIPINLNTNHIDALKAGFSTVVDYEIDNIQSEIEIEPDYRLSNGNYQVNIDDDGLQSIIKANTVRVIGFGNKQIKIGAKEIDQLLQTGQTSARFIENSKASLSITKAGGKMGSLTSSLLNIAERMDLRAGKSINNYFGGQSGIAFNPTASKLPPIEASLPNFPLIVYLPYRQTWELLGYSRGSLLNTLSLAPQEEIIIELLSWSRHKREQENTVGFERENTLEVSLNTKDTYEATDESRRDNGWKFNVSGGFSVPAVGIGIQAGVDVKDEVTKSAKRVVGQVQESVQKATSKIRSTRQTKVIETSESGSENKVTRRIKNPNMGRTLNIDAFEVLANYEVNTIPLVTEARLCVLVPMPDFIAPILQKNLISLLTNQHIIYPNIPKELQLGFEAARKLEIDSRYCRYKCRVACTCETQSNDKPNESIPSGNPLADAESSVLEAGKNVARIINLLNSADVESLGLTIKMHWDNLFNPDPTKRPSSTQWDNGRQEVRRFLYRKLILDGPASRFWGEAKSFASTTSPTISQCESLNSARAIVPADVFNTMIQVGILGLTKIASALAEVVTRWPLVPMDMAPHLGFDDAGMETALNQLGQSLDNLKAVKQRLSTQTGNKTDAKISPEVDKAAKAGTEDAPYSPMELAEASVAYDSLLSYISMNSEFFRTLIWRSVSPDDKELILKTYGRMNEMVTGRVIGFSGSSAVMEFDLTKDQAAAQWFKVNVINNDLLSSQGSQIEVSLPTPGVTLESRLGLCDALEPFLVDSRKAEIRRLDEVAEGLKLENQRLNARIAKGDLDSPISNKPEIRVELDSVKP